MEVRFERGSYNIIFNVLDAPFIDGFLTIYLSGTIGWGLAPSHRITQRGPFQEGDSDIDFRLDPRVLSLPFVAPASTIDNHFSIRNTLLKVFKPGNDTALLRVSWEDQTRYIDVKVIGGLTMDTDSKDFNVRSEKVAQSNERWNHFDIGWWFCILDCLQFVCSWFYSIWC